MGKLFIIAGHGNGDSGAVGGGYQEQERVRALASAIKAAGGSDVLVGDTTKNYYKDNLISTIPEGYMVCELHMDSATATSAKGGHVIIHADFNADKYDTALADYISTKFPGRSTIISKRSDLANPNRAKALGLNYRLLECCFISNSSDLTTFNKDINEIAKGILACFDISATEVVTPEVVEPEAIVTTGYVVRVTASVLNVRKGPGTSYSVTTQIKKGEAYTIVDVDGDWGKLKSGAGWIHLGYTEKV